ncbi:AlpA family transcriptional regulator [Trinickia mobilis]|uniref:AlpA family transcriptional regulator n=1 Tax=Trinickia mobilis TaxID=2816356 RepID=UPI001A906ABA|nr:AlpA family transcriptional regulator [Trinickia mobilis]
MRAINIKQVAAKVSLGQSTIYRMIAKGEFPKPFSLGGNRTAWLEEDIDDWLADKAGKPRPARSDAPDRSNITPLTVAS